MEDLILDLADHLAHHASTGFSECRDLPLCPLAEVGPSLLLDGGQGFKVTHMGRTFHVVVVEDL